MTNLPIAAYKNDILDSLRTGNCLVIRTPTGSGKSTQVPQFISDAGIGDGMILILQPRRIAARMLAARVAEERMSIPGEKVGYSTRFESAVSDQTKILYITEGILPRMLLSDAMLSNVSTVIFDEFHERSITTDLGLALVRELQIRRPDMRLVVMSATLDPDPLMAYLPGTVLIDSPGRMFPIDLRYTSAARTTPAWELAANAVQELLRCGEQGHILVFMPGVYEIRRTIQALETTIRSESVHLLPLYGDLPAHKQQEVMEQSTRRKIIVATNIAETSLTIPGVYHVIDSGLARINRFDAARGFNTLYIEPISIDAADQRAGRAGRESPGICIRLWSKSQHDNRQARTPPEILRIDLSETVLTLLTLGYRDIDSFPWFTPPAPSALSTARDLLQLLGAVDTHGDLSKTGQQMSRLPMHPRLSRLLLAAGERNSVRLAAFTAALLTERSIVNGKPDYPEAASTVSLSSDMYGMYLLFKKLQEASFDLKRCSRYAVNISTAKTVERTWALYIDQCRRLGLQIHDASHSVEGLAEALLLAYPDHLAARRDKGTLICNLRDDRRGELDSGSIVRKARLFVAADIRETRHHAGQVLKPVLSMATEIREEWLLKHFPDNCTHDTKLQWNHSALAVEANSRQICLGVCTGEKLTEIVDMDNASPILAEAIITKKLSLSRWNQQVDEWINRVIWLGELFPEKKFPQFTDGEKQLVVHALCEGYYKYSQVKELSVLPLVQELVNPADYGFIESMAPQSIPLPTGRTMRLSYSPGKPPHGRTRIQDLYGQNETPVIAGGRARVTIELLAPNNRPVQITDDLRSFWEIHYPNIKKSLSRRFPKHVWR